MSLKDEETADQYEDLLFFVAEILSQHNFFSINNFLIYKQ